ncbi:MAG: hypothetical protein UY89_C0007G0007 [Parcubacteria group bacterium GW2011_GWA1_54_9]|nr:MAG: hypothetical protein UY89_C0007G0007 [Parcubacteria group bacterium GW2011_GWA1_54_9]
MGELRDPMEDGHKNKIFLGKKNANATATGTKSTPERGRII